MAVEPKTGERSVPYEITPPALEIKSLNLQHEQAKIGGRVNDYLRELPNSAPILGNESRFYERINQAEDELLKQFKKQAIKFSTKKKVPVDRSMLVRWYAASMIQELNRGTKSVHHSCLESVGQISRRILLSATEMSNKHLQDEHGNTVIVDREWSREFSMELFNLRYPSKPVDLTIRLRQYVENPPLQAVDQV